MLMESPMMKQLFFAQSEYGGPFFMAMRDTASPTLKCLNKSRMQSQFIVLDLLLGYLEPYAILLAYVKPAS